ncbi:MAG: hypothetical protein FWG63_08525 [Defluviitaleaceae bacterium]|nr:hypothetical protein [Defluviitaleaceae bacterium]
MLKRFIARLMVFIFVFGYFAGIAGQMQVFANAPTLEIRTIDRMESGTLTPAPMVQPRPSSDNPAFEPFRTHAYAVTGNLGSHGTYHELEFILLPVTALGRHVLTINMDNTVAYAQLWRYDATTGNRELAPISHIHMAPDPNDMLTLDAFLEMQVAAIPPGENWEVVYYEPAAGGPGEVTFRFQEGQGFSFRSNGVDYHIRLSDGAIVNGPPAGSLQFAAQAISLQQGFIPGYIHQFILRSVASGAPGVAVGTVSIERFNTGITGPDGMDFNSGISIIPFANIEEDAAGDFPIFDTANRRYRIISYEDRIFHSRHYLHFDGGNAGFPDDPTRPPFTPTPGRPTVGPALEYNEFPRWPAQPDEGLGLRIEFEVPGVVEGADPLPPGALPAIVYFEPIDGIGSQGGFLINFADIRYPDITTPVVAGVAPPTLAHYGFTDQGNVYLYVLVPADSPFLPGILYSPSASFIGLNNINTLDIRAFNTHIEGAYTLPTFRVVMINGFRYVEIDTFNTFGEYILAESIFPLSHFTPGQATLSRTGVVDEDVETVRIPLTSDAIGPNNEGVYLQVFFRPGPVGFSAIGASAGVLLNPATRTDGAFPVLRSQILQFVGSPYDISLLTPSIFTVLPVPPGHTPLQGQTDRGEVTLELTWDIGGIVSNIVNLFDRYADMYDPDFPHGFLDIYYDVSWSLNPYLIEPEGTFVRIRARIFREEELIPGDIPPPFSVIYELVDRSTNPPHDDGLDDNTDMNAVLVYPLGPTELLTGPGGVHIAMVHLHVQTIHENADGGTIATLPGIGPLVPPRAFRFPEIYFLNIGPIYMTTAGVEGMPSASNYHSFTLSEFDVMQVPSPQNLRVANETTTSELLGDDEDRISFDLIWDMPSEQIRDFLLYSHGLFSPAFTPEALERLLEMFDIYMNIYISQDEELMTGSFVETNDADSASENPPPPRMAARHGLATVVDYIEYDGVGNTLFFSEIRQGVTPLMVGTQYARDVLRQDGSIIAITGVPMPEAQWESILTSPLATALTPFTITYTLDGLDANQQYFVFVDLVITQRDLDTDFTDYAASLLSSLVGVTLPGHRVPPDGVDQEPPAPELWIVEDSITLNAATVAWYRVDGATIPEGFEETIEYEIIRIRDNQATAADQLTAWLNNRAPFGTVWGTVDHHTDIFAFRTEGDTLQEWTGTAFGPLLTPPQFVFDPANPINITDNTLASNTLYFYYVRAIRTVLDGDGNVVAVTWSVWSHISVTTDIVAAPRNLLVASYRDDYDRQTEVMITFEAPLPFATFATELGTNFVLQYQIMIDDGQWPPHLVANTMRSEFLIEHAQAVPDEPFWTHFLYHIYGITPGRIHFVRVRLAELDENGNPINFSMWSNTATWLADTDPTLNEEERLIDDWRRHLLNELHRMLISPYWIMRNDPMAFSVILRPSLFDEMILTSHGSQIILPFIMAPQTSFYIPASVFVQAHNADLSFVIPAQQMTITIPHGAVDINNNQAMLSAGGAVRNHEISDYLVRVNVDWQLLQEVHGQTTITPVADIGISVIASDVNLVAWEAVALEALIDRIDELTALDSRYFATIIDGIRRSMAQEPGGTNFALARSVLDILEEAERNFLNVILENFMNVRAQRAPFPVQFDRAILLQVRTGDGTASITAFQWVTALWAEVATTFDNGRGIMVSAPGAFVFAGRVIDIPNLTGMPGSGQAIGIVARHGLDDFFGPGTIDTNDTATRAMLTESVARMLGAPRGTPNANAWLRNNGVNLPPGAATAPISTQEALHFVMVVYEVQTGTRAETIRITNFGLTSNLQGLNPTFATSFRAAVELGLYTNINLQPTATVTIGGLLDILTALDTLIGL